MPLPPPPAEIADDQANDTRPPYPEGDVGEALHEGWVDDALDWGDRRDLLAYRWCELWNKRAEVQTNCGPDPRIID
ncbi:MAG TPA: hypothetical protein DF966_18240 [Sulfitobacter sp.]|nr:hypothetical protein [Sulfitobacter sp.]